MTTPTVSETKNPNGTTTYRISALVNWFTTNRDEVEQVMAQYAEVGNWVQEK